jgi:hypothetical protein
MPDIVSTAPSPCAGLPRRLKVGVGAAMLNGVVWAAVLIATMTAAERLLVLGLAPWIVVRFTRRWAAIQVVTMAWAAVSCACAVAVVDAERALSPLLVFGVLLAAAAAPLFASAAGAIRTS